MDAQKVDRDYKELSIRPRLQWSTHSTDLSVNLDNVGLGPALIKGFSMRVGGKCTRFEKGDRGVEGKMRDMFADALLTSLGSEITQSKLMLSKYMLIRTYIPESQEAISASKNIKLLEADSASLAEIVRMRKALGSEELREMNDRFFRAMRELGIAIKYCSLTERFCESTALSQGGCLAVL
jgi:hypothetical protein